MALPPHGEPAGDVRQVEHAGVPGTREREARPPPHGQGGGGPGKRRRTPRRGLRPSERRSRRTRTRETARPKRKAKKSSRRIAGPATVKREPADSVRSWRRPPTSSADRTRSCSPLSRRAAPEVCPRSFRSWGRTGFGRRSPTYATLKGKADDAARAGVPPLHAAPRRGLRRDHRVLFQQEAVRASGGPDAPYAGRGR